MSRVKRWFGSGGRMKSVGASARPITLWTDSGSSWVVTPPVNRVASSPGRHLGHPRGQLVREHLGDLLRPQAAGEQPRARLGVLERRRQQVVEEQHLDAVLAHQVDERVELLPRAANPDHVVEEELVAVRRREPVVGEVGAVHEHRPERPHLGVRAERVRGDGCHRVAPFTVVAPPLRSGRARRRRRTTRPRAALHGSRLFDHVDIPLRFGRRHRPGTGVRPPGDRAHVEAIRPHPVGTIARTRQVASVSGSSAASRDRSSSGGGRSSSSPPVSGRAGSFRVNQSATMPANATSSSDVLSAFSCASP